MGLWGFRTVGTTPRPKEVPATGPEIPDRPATDDAWRTLQVVMDLIKHAETKAAAILAAAGVLGGLLYTLVSKQPRPGLVLTVAAVVCATAIATSAAGAGIALRPRELMRRPAASTPRLLFYRSVAEHFPGDSDSYVRRFTDLTADRPALMAEVATQVWANSVVATRKYRAANVAVTALLTALALLAVTATLALVLA
jgi:hypothetical protein